MSVDKGAGNCRYGVFPGKMDLAHSDMLSRLDVGVVCLDKDGRFIHFNKTIQDITGITDADVIGKELHELLSSYRYSGNSLLRNLMSAGDQNHGSENTYLKLVTHDGYLKYLTCEQMPCVDENGICNGTIFFIRDETIRTVCSNDRLFSNYEMDTSHLPFVSFLCKGDDTWSVEYVSDNIVQFGYDPAALLSGKLSFADIVHSDHIENIRNAVDSCTDEYFSHEYMILPKHGEPRWVLERSYAVRDDDGNITHFHGAVLDIHERKLAEKELESMNLQERALSTLGSKALSCNNVDALMDYAVELVATTLDIKCCLIMERLSDGRFLLRYGYGVSDWCIGSVIVGGDSASQAGMTVVSGKPLIMRDTEKENRFQVPRFLYEHGILSGVCVIIGSMNSPFGTLCAYADEKRQFSEHDINFLKSVSNILAESIGLRESIGSLELYKKMIGHSNDYIMVLDTVTKKFDHVSDRVIEDLGFSESELMSQNVFEPGCFMRTMDMFDVIRKAADEGTFVVASEFIRKNGTSFPVDISFSFVENEGRIYMVLIGRDVTEREKAHRILHESRTKLSAIFENATDLICLSDLHGRILQINKTMTEFMGYQNGELVDSSLEDLFSPDIRMDVQTIIAEVVSKGSITVEIDMLKKNGDSLPMEIKIQLIEYNDKKRLLSMGRDVSERRLLEEAIRGHAEQLEYSNNIKDMFADVTSHDLISSVSLIEGYVDYLTGVEEDNDKVRILETITASTEKLKRTINSASLFAKMNSSKELELQTMDLRYVYRNSVDRLFERITSRDIDVALNAPDSCPAYMNPIMEEVFFNLLSNAIKYSPEGDEVLVGIESAGDRWKVSVSDHGPGISDEDKSKIFDRFSKASNSDVSGKGLGLAIARLALKCHGEELHVDDNVDGKGSTFWFNVRVSDEFDDFQ
ncbi:PAS domain S-box protein [Methanolobus sp. WCC4]|uniref:PAS domain S-box protein n=1 Tax=Methanolobus sp. WCC4 TaxID=3125784 RepID=UPI0030FACDEF